MVATLIPERQMFRKTNDVEEVDGHTVTYHHEYLEELPPSTSKAQDISAVRYLIDALLESDGDITIIAVGPLTNIVSAMRADPRVIGKIKKLVIMGGGHLQTNTSSAAEFNIWKDPEAAQIVLTSGCDVLLVPLDATHEGDVTLEESKEMNVNRMQI